MAEPAEPEAAEPAEPAEPEAAEPAEPEAAGAESYFGRAKSYNFARGFGFLECPEVQAAHGRDVFMRKEDVEELTLSRIASSCGPEAAKRREVFVRFSVRINEKGHPEACEVKEVKASELPAGWLEQLPLVEAQPAKKDAKGGGKDSREGGYGREGKKGKENKQLKECKEGKESDNGRGGVSKSDLRVAGCRVHVGQDAEDNWNILAGAKGRHWFFHLTDHPSCYVILECNEPTAEEKLLCAQICRDHTKHKLSGQVKVDATQCNNVKFDRKRDVVGECDYKNEDKVEVLVVK